MASAQPVRQQSQRRASPEQAATDQTASSPARARSEYSEDSQTVILTASAVEDAHSETLSSKVLDDHAARETRSEAAQKQEQLDTEEVKECWVCRADSTEDTPETSPWRDPCPCALVAHEDCLLDWIASKENERSNSDSSVLASKISCPQCKAEIRLSRPRDYVVDVARLLDRLQGRLVLPGAISVFASTLYYSCMAVGKHSIYAVFGAEDGFEIMQPMFLAQLRPPLEVWIGTRPNLGKLVLGMFVDHIANWKLYLGVPLITPILILSRTSIADPILPVLPLLFFATQGPIPRPIIHDPFEWVRWPPSAGLAFSLLPYVRQAYNAVYSYTFGEREREWLRLIQPRAGEQEGADAPGGDGNRRDDGNLFEVRIEGDVVEEWEDQEGNRHEHIRPMMQNAPAAPDNGIPADGEQADPPPNIADNRPQNAAPAQPAQGGRRLAFSPIAVAESVLGALAFPTIAGLSGELLKALLPRAWTTLPAGRPQAQYLLQTKWGRSLVAGCGFVVLKDALLLYVRWRMAQIHRQRHVLSIDRSRL